MLTSERRLAKARQAAAHLHAGGRAWGRFGSPWKTEPNGDFGRPPERTPGDDSQATALTRWLGPRSAPECLPLQQGRPMSFMASVAPAC